LIYTKNPVEWTWNYKSVMVPCDRAVKYKDKRTESSKESGLKVPGTVWGIDSDGPYWGRVSGNSKERQKECPNQLPEVYLARLIKAYTNPGDIVADPFAGSGTTAAVAVALGRHVVTMDVSKTNFDLVVDRIKKGTVRL
jgi:DNA modification methylase